MGVTDITEATVGITTDQSRNYLGKMKPGFIEFYFSYVYDGYIKNSRQLHKKKRRKWQ